MFIQVSVLATAPIEKYQFSALLLPVRKSPSLQRTVSGGIQRGAEKKSEHTLEGLSIISHHLIMSLEPSEKHSALLGSRDYKFTTRKTLRVL